MNYLHPKRLVGYAMAAAFMLVAGRVGLEIWRDFQDALWLRDAARVGAEILDYQIENIPGPRGGRLVTFSYAYTVSGQRYQRTTHRLGPFVDRRAEADRIIAAAKRGQTVTCFVDLENPETGLLSRNMKPLYVVIWVGFGSVFAILSWCILYGCLSKRYAHQFS